MDIKLYENLLIELIKCGLSGETPKEIAQNIDFGVLIEVARKHSVANIIYEPLKKTGVLGASNEQKLKLFYNFAIVNDTVLTHYLDLLSDRFEKEEIPHCVMKGPVIKKLYPRSDFRQSSDLDIFVPKEFRQKAHDIMLDLGFQIERFNAEDADDSYFIEKKVKVELHRILVSNKTPWQEECQKIADRLVLSDNKKFTYEMTKEDYYLYMIAHMAKHMKYSGMGIKMVLDIFVYINRYGDVLDKMLIKERLNKCGLVQFEEKVTALTNYWFGGDSADEFIQKLGDYVFVSGAFGTKKQLDSYFLAEEAGSSDSDFVTKVKYYIKFFFQPYSYMCKKYPVLIKMPFLLPFLWVYRALRTILFDREKAHKIASKYDNVNVSESKRIQKFKEELGL